VRARELAPSLARDFEEGIDLDDLCCHIQLLLYPELLVLNYQLEARRTAAAAAASQLLQHQPPLHMSLEAQQERIQNHRSLS
jgi:hypothetical protein